MKKGEDSSDLSLLGNVVQVSVSTTAFMTAVSVFFAGLLITNFSEYSLSIKIPILFLILSTFGFLYSTLIYANSTGSLMKFKKGKFYTFMEIGDSLAEYVGVYFLVFAIPLAVNAVTSDPFLRYSVFICSMIGLMVYHFSGFTLMQSHFKNKEYPLVFFLFLMETGLFFTQDIYPRAFMILATVLILFLFILTYLSAIRKPYTD